MIQLSPRRLTLAVSLILTPFAPAVAQLAYQSPPADLLKILEAPANPVTSVSPDHQWVLVTVSDPRSITISDMADSAYYLGGSKIRANPDYRVENIGVRTATVSNIDGKTVRSLDVPAGGRIGTAAWSVNGNKLAYSTISKGTMAIEILDLPNGATRRANASGLSGKIGDLDWSRDGKNLAFTVTTPAGTALWIADVQSGSARRLTPPNLNFTTARGNIVDDAGCNWLEGRAPLVCRLWPANRGAAPKISDVPGGVIVQESYGRSAPARTYEYLLQSPTDETLFDYYFTDQIALVGLDGRITPIGQPGVHLQVTPSPDGNYLLVETVQRPYSYQVPMEVFPSRTEVWNMSGKVVREIRNSHVAEEAPSARDAVLPGIRSVSWRPDVPATLVLVEALDSGNPRKTVARRDQVSLLSAPFTGAATPFVQTEYRYGGIMWVSPRVAFLADRLSRGARRRVWMIDPSAPNGGTPKLIWDRSTEDRYSDPGSWVFVLDPATVSVLSHYRGIPAVKSWNAPTMLRPSGGEVVPRSRPAFGSDPERR